MKIITLVHCSTADGNLKINVGIVTVSIIIMSLAKSCKSGFIPGVGGGLSNETDRDAFQKFKIYSLKATNLSMA